MCTACGKCLPCCAIIFFFGTILNTILYIMMAVETPYITWTKDKTFFHDTANGGNKFYKDSKVSALIAAIVYAILTITFTMWVFWRNSRINTNKELFNSQTGYYRHSEDED
mmetsp:Transcript_13048/g.1911  ORF Transcript_13048/g.1911 Transcript_13048/m.1911 type:complete len:111 (+) Transcript_13048:59-391(+)